MVEEEETRRVVLVTGSSGGIGEAIARRFDSDGYSVVCHGFQSVEAGQLLASELSDAMYVDGDVRAEEDVARISHAVRERYGTLDALVNNAGVAVRIPHASLDEVTDEIWDTILGVNLVGPWKMIRAFRDLLQSRAGSVVNIGSIAGLSVSGSSIPYAVSKAGLLHMTRLLAVALGPEIRVNAVAPGFIETPLTSEWDDVKRTIKTKAPLRRLGEVDDIAGAVAFLAVNEYATGVVLPVDGGMHLA